MACGFATESVQVRVADLANSPAIRCDPRLDLNNFEPQISYPRINHQFLSDMRRADYAVMEGSGAPFNSTVLPSGSLI